MKAKIIHAILIALIAPSLPLSAQTAASSDENYIKTTTYYGATSRNVNIVYYDNFGYPVQTIACDGGNAAGNHVVTDIEYDAFHRPVRNYLPYSSATTLFSPPSEYCYDDSQHAYYDAKFGSSNADAAYSENCYESFASGQLASTRRSGAAWKNADKKVNTIRRANNAADCILDIEGESAPTSIELHISGVIAPSSLKCEEVTDEDGGKVMTFTDAFGKKVCSRRLIDTSVNGNPRYADTYYAYDQYDRLVCILQPEGSASLTSQEQTLTENDALVRKYCFTYLYDGFGRLLEKKVPGCGKEEFVYDDRDRPVLWRSANLKENGQWISTQYDVYNCIVCKKLVTGTNSRAPIQCLYNSSGSVQDIVSDVCTLEEYCYARDGAARPSCLSYVSLNSTVANSDAVGLGESVFEEPSASTNRKIYEKIAVLPTDDDYSSVTFVERAYWYDHRGNVLQSVEKDASGRILRNAFSYDRQGNVLYSYEGIEGNGVEPVSKFICIDRDNCGRVTRERCYMPADSNLPATDVTYAYDDLGRPSLLECRDGNSSKVRLSRTYTMQGSLHSIVGDAVVDADTSIVGFPVHISDDRLARLMEYRARCFQEELSYESPSTGIPQYSGRISEIRTKRQKENALFHSLDSLLILDSLNIFTPDGNGSANGSTQSLGLSIPDTLPDDTEVPVVTTYSYNKAGWLTGSQQFNVENSNNGYAEYGITYDRNGNLLTLTRESPNQATDFIYTYNGNCQTGVETENAYYANDFDSNGNMTCRDVYSEPLLTIRYNLLNLPSEVTTETMTSTCSTLADGTKRSTTLTSGGGTSSRLYSGSSVFCKNPADTAYRFESTSFAMGRICRDSTGTPVVQTYIPDHLGSMAAIFENGHAVAEENDYFPYGLRTANQSLCKSSRNRWRFCGKEELPLPDDGSHLDFGARIYDAGTGVRWLSVDPLADKHPEMSPYSYCNNDPVNNIDLDGRDVWNIDLMGNIIEQIGNPEFDMLQIVEKTDKGEYLPKPGAFIKFNYGTIISAQEENGNTFFELCGSNNGINALRIMADNSSVEWLCTTFKDDISVLRNSHHEGDAEFRVDESKGALLSNIYHSHPHWPGASEKDKNMLMNLQEHFGINIRAFIYYVPKGVFNEYNTEKTLYSPSLFMTKRND